MEIADERFHGPDAGVGRSKLSRERGVGLSKVGNGSAC